MKLIFKKDSDETIKILIRDGLAEQEFSYIKMVKSLIESNSFEDSEFIGEISEKEKEVVSQMLLQINSAIGTQKK